MIDDSLAAPALLSVAAEVVSRFTVKKRQVRSRLESTSMYVLRIVWCTWHWTADHLDAIVSFVSLLAPRSLCLKLTSCVRPEPCSPCRETRKRGMNEMCCAWLAWAYMAEDVHRSHHVARSTMKRRKLLGE